MKKIINLVLCLCLSISIYSGNIIITNASTPRRVAIVSCTKSHTEIDHISTGYSVLKQRTGYWIDSGNSVTFTTTYSDTINNSATISLIPDLLAYGYQRTYTVSSGVSETVNNNSSSKREVGLYYLYDIVYYDQYTYVSEGNCSVTYNQSKNVYSGHMYALI